jgi:NADH-quinone oxidoreductase subunit M
MNNILTWLTFLPIIGMVVILLIPNGKNAAESSAEPTGWKIIRWVALATTAICLVLAVQLYLVFERGTSAIQFEEVHAWIPAFNIQYHMGVDGVSILMVLLTQLIGIIGVIASWKIPKAVKGYFALYLLLQAGMTGVFVSLDFVLFYVFWEVMLLPMYFLIGIWGGPRKEYAAIKFFLYTLLGSVLMLLAILGLYFNLENPTFDMVAMMNQANYSPTGWLANNAPTWFLAFTPKQLVWLGFFIAFAIKVPAFPFHTWLPDAHVEAPTAISVILAGVLLKMGTYGIFRVNFAMMPDTTVYFAKFIAVIGLINIVYGALCAMAQKDLKALVAYSSISHMGYVMLGMVSWHNAAGINGAMFQMFNHGTITAMMFLLVGVIYDRAHHRDINGFGGLWAKVPIYSGFVAIAFMAALGLPGMSGFISELMVFIGAFMSYRLIAIIGTLGIVLGAAYLLWTIQRMFFGTLNPKYETLKDINAREITALVPLLIIVVFLGVYPAPALDLIGASLGDLLITMQNATANVAEMAVPATAALIP